jgi:hypothetical protein
LFEVVFEDLEKKASRLAHNGAWAWKFTNWVIGASDTIDQKVYNNLRGLSKCRSHGGASIHSLEGGRQCPGSEPDDKRIGQRGET